VWEYLPEEAALITPRQGYEAFYWRMVYETRPDVLLPFLQNPQPAPADLSGRDVYATERALGYAYSGGALGLPGLSTTRIGSCRVFWEANPGQALAETSRMCCTTFRRLPLRSWSPTPWALLRW
jgi:hypothetical protein